MSLSKYRVEYEIEGDYDPSYFSLGDTQDGMITVPCPSIFLPDDHIPYRIPNNAKVTEVLEDGYYLNPHTGTLFRRASDESEGIVVWERFDAPSVKEKGDWQYSHVDDAHAVKFEFERLNLHFSGSTQ